jgi:hypothetical protein
MMLCFSSQAMAANFWLSTSGSIGTGSAPPASPATVGSVSHPVGTPSGSIYVWARPDSGKTLERWSLNLISTNSDILNLTSASVESLNPVLGNTGSPSFEDIVRWEYVDEPTGSPTSLLDIQGFSIFQIDRTGVGVGPSSTGSPYNDPLYDSANNSWLLAQIDYSLTGTQGETQLFLQIGSYGLKNLGENTSASNAVFGAITDTPLNGDTNRMQNSSTADFVVTVSAAVDNANFDGDADVDGIDFLIWQRGYGLPSPTFEQGDANHDGMIDGLDLLVWEQQYAGPPVISALNVVPEPATSFLALLVSICLCWMRFKVTNGFQDRTSVIPSII